MKHVKCYKDEYPRPQFVRNNFTSLDGKWFFAFDDLNIGEENIHNIKICPEHDVSEEEIILKGD